MQGIGDDAAVVRALPVCVTSLDTMVDGVHFRLAAGWMTPAQVGWRALAGALSDLAAMGVRAGEAYLSLGLPHGISEQAALQIVSGADALARSCETEIAGGDVVSSPVLSVSVTVVGWAASEREIVMRAGANVGDLVGVTGTLGGAGAALTILEGRAEGAEHRERLLERTRAPVPRLTEGAVLAANGASAMIDLSDGLASDAAQLARAGCVGLQIDLESLPVQAGVGSVAAELGVSVWDLAAASGDDYELCFCAPERLRGRIESALADCGGVDVSWVGRVLEGNPAVPVLELREHGQPRELRGFEHRWGS